VKLRRRRATALEKEGMVLALSQKRMKRRSDDLDPASGSGGGGREMGCPDKRERRWPFK
jgi:hypothetical protein